MQHLQVLILKMPRFLSMKSDTSFNIIWPQSSSYYKKKIKNTLSVRSFSILISCDFKTTFCDLLKKNNPVTPYESNTDTIDGPQDGCGVQYYPGKALRTQVIMQEVFIPGKLKYC